MDSMDKVHLSEQSSPGASEHFPAELPPRPRLPPAASPSWSPHMRGFWIFSPSSYSIIQTPDKAARVRHVAMFTILLLRSTMSALSILYAIAIGSVAGVVAYSLLAVLSLWFTATCLAIIGDAAGDERVNGAIVKRWYLDTFLGACVLIHAGLIVAFFFGLTGWGLEIASVGMWLAILGVAWIAGWQPQLPTYRKKWVA